MWLFTTREMHSGKKNVCTFVTEQTICLMTLDAHSMKANEFEASKHQRQIVNRFNHFIQEGDEHMEKDIATRMNANQDTPMTEDISGPEPMDETPVNEKKQKPRKPPKNAPTDLRSRIHSSEYKLSAQKANWKHRFRVRVHSDLVHTGDAVPGRFVLISIHYLLLTIGQAGTFILHRREARAVRQVSDERS